MPGTYRISRYNHDTHRIEWVDASEAEHAAWKAARGSGAGRQRKWRQRPAQERTEPLEADTSGRGPVTTDKPPLSGGTKQARGSGRKPNPGTGPLTPIIGLAARLLSIGVSACANLLTGGRHPMTGQEAVSIGAPAARILNRWLGKHISWVPSVGGEYSAELERIGTGLASWGLRGIARATNAADAEAQAAQQPIRPQVVSQFVADMAEPAPDMADDGADLFSGSEPVAAGAGSVPAAGLSAGPRPIGAPIMPERPVSGPAGALSVPDSVWNSLSPGDIGLAGAMPNGS